MFVISYGTVVDGFKFYGPFNREDDAVKWARDTFGCDGDYHWDIIRLKNI